MSIRDEVRKHITEQYIKRLEQLNVNAETKTVLDSIDRPMRPLIIELHRIGLETTFCCCGFTYEGEEEPKNHIGKFTYVFIKNNVENELAKDNLDKLLTTITNPSRGNWAWGVSHNIKTPDGIPLIHLYFKNVLPNLYNNNDDIPAIHDYESQVVSIKHAIDFAKKLPTVNETIIIHDGNNDFFEAGFDEWQVEPKSDYINKEI